MGLLFGANPQALCGTDTELVPTEAKPARLGGEMQFIEDSSN